MFEVVVPIQPPDVQHCVQDNCHHYIGSFCTCKASHEANRVTSARPFVLGSKDSKPCIVECEDIAVLNRL